MNAKCIFEEMEKRSKKLEEMINDTIEGNCEENKYTYDEQSRKNMQKELDILETTMSFMDEEMSKQ